MYDDILLPTDGSDATVAAIDHAVALAERFDATLHGLYVIDTSERFYEDAIEKLNDEAQARGERSLSAVLDATEGTGVIAEAEVQRGVPYKTVNDYVEANDIDLIVMGTHGRTGFDRMVLGSTTEKVVRTADVPVMTVRADEVEET
ncbi:MAG: universal stress protein [Candidatus Nanohaloarchaeota archaeon QJJ-5]|nr:universal stress protein [Candidatus Nanohaloarchaeota archaeon QJJ-5]